MNLFKCSYKSLGIYCNNLRRKNMPKSKKPYLKAKVVRIFSSNPRVNGKWKVKRLIKNLKRVKILIATEQDTQNKISLLKAFSSLVTPYSQLYYEEKRKSKKSQLATKTNCLVCKEETAYCNHHIQLLVNGGVNSDYNLIPICRNCHKQIHSWLN